MSSSPDADLNTGSDRVRSGRRGLLGSVAQVVSASSSADLGMAGTPIDQHRAEYRRPPVWLWRRLVGGAYAFLLVTVAWYFIKIPDGLVSDRALPTLTQVARAVTEVRTRGFGGATLAGHLGASLVRLTLGSLLGVSVGRLLGLAAGSAPAARSVVDPLSSWLRMVPALAVGPMMVVWFGTGQTTMVMVVATVTLWATMDSSATARTRELRSMATAGRLHEMVSGLRQALAAGWAAVLAIETIMASRGMGPLIWSAQERPDVILAGVIVTGLAGLAIDAALRTVEYLITADRHGRPVPVGRAEPADPGSAMGTGPHRPG